MKNRGANVSRQPGKFLIGLVLKARLELFRFVLGQCLLLCNAARYPKGIRCDLAVFLGVQVVGGNGGLDSGVPATNTHGTAARRVEVTNAGGNGWKVMQRLAKCLQTQWLNVVLDVGVLIFFGTAGKQTELGGGHAHGAGAGKQILQPNSCLANQ